MAAHAFVPGRFGKTRIVREGGDRAGTILTGELDVHPISELPNHPNCSMNFNQAFPIKCE
ncbi:hypothetical protein [Amycolatopsis taiwanensis]|uniref:Uncharacterized protein n=1 Tax=Amycolatopsis taiwanensis TaxID=342230 RepID=A0A9W6RAV3_9PSEU|nr:hypothetical protein [Amycolatopsis taiwanensis]GLY70585.1 hypothetical protein Atai01_72040 [Amycolatopsis taiwanensis]